MGLDFVEVASAQKCPNTYLAFRSRLCNLVFVPLLATETTGLTFGCWLVPSARWLLAVGHWLLLVYWLRIKTMLFTTLKQHSYDV